MRKYVTILFLFGISILFLAMKNTDRYNEDFFPKEGSFFMTMIEYKSGKKIREYEFKGFLKGVDRYMLKALAPRVMKGWVQMRKGNVVYTYNKKIDFFDQISAESNFMQSLFSQEDIMTLSLSALYKVDKQIKVELNGKKVVLLEYIPLFKDSSYKLIESFYDIDSGLPIERRYYDENNRMIKRMIIKDIQFNNNRLIRYEFVMEDLLQKGRKAKVTFDRWNYSTVIKDRYFSETYMKVMAR